MPTPNVAPSKLDNASPRPIQGGVSNTAIDTKQRVQAFVDRKSGRIEQARTGAREIIPQLASAIGCTPEDNRLIPGMFHMAKDRGVSLSQMLEACDPSDQYNGDLAHMDAFQRQLFVAGIRTKSLPEKGIFADKLDRFFQSNVPGSQVLYPEYINRVMRQPMIAPDILPYIVTTVTGVDNDAYRTIYTNESQADRTMTRVGQGAELPKTSLKTAENVVHLYKYGRLLTGTYEFFRTVTIPLFEIMLQRIALQANLDKAGAAVDVLQNGDGNANAAANFTTSVLDTSQTSNYTMSYQGFINFALKFYPYTLTTLVGNADSFVRFLTMSRPTVDPFQIMAALTQKSVIEQEIKLPQGLYTNVQLVYLPTAPSNILIGLDQRFALEQVVENGSSLVETDRMIQTQVNDVAISEKVGFAKIFQPAVYTWTWNA